ncbi:Hemicentin-1 [Bagarius yarrelli]|uniref:Hemicentin-1 n=1 Tax=Bagarius yarrelli TaxID=175774 RepID=A0A556V397_BAGYA|nr:Hemicentin-1 [Bagarius yarrelli]
MLTLSFLAQITLPYDIQDTITKLSVENAYLQHRLEKLTQSLQELRKHPDHLTVFSVKPEDGVGVLNRSLMLHCAAYDTSSQTALLVKWEKQNGGLSAGVQRLANGSLFFSWLEDEDLGGYICSARKGSKQIRSGVTVSKAYLENVFFGPQSQSAPEGQGVFFQCVSGESSPPAHIFWLKNSRVFTRGTQIQGQYGGGSQRKTSGTLHLTNITKQDQGQYVCVTYNPLLNISKESSKASLIVGGFRMSLEIMQGPENITVAVETSAVLHCVVHGFPTPKVQWFKDGQTLPNTSRWNLHDDGQLLVFKSVLSEDEGFYYCEAENNKETLRSQSAYLLPAVMDWTFVLQPVNKTVRKGDPVTLNCRPPHSRPPAQISWFRNNHLLQSRSHISTQSTGDLLFLSQFGIIVVLLVILTAPPSVTLWPLAVISAVGAEVIIQCQVSGHPVPSIDWLKHGQSVRTGGKISKGARNSTLYISSVRIYDEGYYTCAASNTVGQDEKTTRLRIADNETLHISNAHQSDTGEYYCTAENNMGQDRRKTIITVFSDINLKNSSTLQHKNRGNKKYKALLITPEPHSVISDAKTPEVRTQKRHVTQINSIIDYTDQQKFQTSNMQPEFLSAHYQTIDQNSIESVSDQHTNSKLVEPSSNSVVQAHEPTQTSGFTMNNLNNVTSTTPVEVHQYRSQLTEQFTVTKASQANYTELIEMLDKNTSKAPMRTTANNARGIGGPCRPGEHLAIERTYDNKAFENDNMVAVIEQSPNMSEIRAYPPASSPSTLLLEPSCDDAQVEFQPSQDMSVIVETHLKPSEDRQLETSFEEGKSTPSLPSDVQLQCMEDWRSQDSGQCQRGAPSPPPSNSLGTQEEGLHSTLTLQTLDSSSTPVHHSISLSHANCPLMLSHCVTLGMTSVSVDVHFYPSDPTQYRHQTNSRHEHDQSALSSHHGKP